jgi:serine/threonine protein kinase
MAATCSVLGRGGFGVVNGCKKNNTGRLYAMKTMNKRRIKQKNAADLCWNERIVLGKVDSPFVISLKYAFSTEDDLFLILDLATGSRNTLAIVLNLTRLHALSLQAAI